MDMDDPLAIYNRAIDEAKVNYDKAKDKADDDFSRAGVIAITKAWDIYWDFNSKAMAYLQKAKEKDQAIYDKAVADALAVYKKARADAKAAYEKAEKNKGN